MNNQWPSIALPPMPCIHSLSLEAVGLSSSALYPNQASAAYPSANYAYYIPFHLQQPILVTKMASWNGATAIGNIDLGIYSPDGRRIVSSGSTAQAGTNDLQVFDITDTPLGPGDYFMAIAKDDATGTLFMQALNVNNAARSGMFGQASAFPLPATATFAKVTQAFIISFGLLQGRTTI